ncbi:peptidylprolyl isomerase [Longibacter salinarum]|uniref:Periplasmic chaperone PpiD n=2 Tax=Longibacter salinarum TaxID=1850348 RepID=A0A2A8D1X8_9BACT|nr:peptidylprolyl isomerase [Longibacter salinarum]
MGVMNNLRQNTGVVLWILVFSFGVIWVLQDSQAFDAIGAQPRDIAVVNGEAIPYQEYQQTLEQLRERAREQSDGELTQAQRDQLEEQAYDQLVTSRLLEQEMERLGITVTNAELLDMVYGENPHPIIRQQFADSTGEINYQLLNNFAQNPEAKATWAQIENYMREQRRQQKMSNIVQATVHVSDADVKNYYERQNTNADIRYVLQRYASVPNDSVNVSDADLEAYYDENKEDFSRERTYTIQYVQQEKLATEQDTQLVRDDLRRLKEEFAAADDDSTFLQINASAQDYSKEYRTPDQMPSGVASAIYENLEPGTVVGPIFANNAGHLLKIKDTRPADQTYVHASHILLRVGESAGDETVAEIRSRIEALQDSLNQGASFADLAKRHSADGSASRGGDLGWFTRDRMVEPFANAAFGAEAGEVVGPVRTRFGFHLIKVQQKTSEAVQYADMAYSLDPSPATLNDFQAKLEDIAYFSEDGGDFEEEAQNAGYDVRTVQVEEDARNIPGVGRSASLMRFLSEADEGQISNVYELDDKFILAKVTGITEEGYRPFEDVKNEIRPRVLTQKKKDIVLGQMRSAMNGANLDALASALGTRVRTKTGLNFGTRRVAGLGNDRSIIGVAFGLDVGATSGVMEGENAAYVVNVTNRTEPAELTEEKREQIRQQLLAQEQRQIAQQYISGLRENAEITDNRSKLLN